MRLAPHVQVGGLMENPTMPLYTARRITRHGAGNTRGSHRNELTGVARQLDRHAMRAENRVFGSVARSPDAWRRWRTYQS
jgi:hypothetical protein